ncbi:hypothetical protein [Okeania sp. KiyG1]|uniref:hypothetical protein n=1 Tax=Okeania sp. KiyG1 TaxID=2720165 RepID=UPI0019241B18|nr:hypothetical protein [Okeania sp. KiyG1]GGA00037.1 hypothetical protein CYANOKiyG1_11670 [Okeania sp. KiyG1]
MTSDSSNSEQSHPKEKPQNQLEEEDIRRELLRGREFTLADVIGQEGGGFMKGESPVPKLVQVKAEINTLISQNLRDVSGVLEAVLYRWVDEDTARISKHLDSPLQALLGLLKSILENPPILHELVRQVDMLWGKINNERPYFQRPGEPAHPDDEYTHESVYQQLVELTRCLNSKSS